MSWVKIDDLFPDHPKVVALGVDAAFGISMHVAALCYSSRHLTDGFLPGAQAVRLVLLPPKTAEYIVRRLVEVGMWEPVDGGYNLHDYLDFNPSRERVLAERQAAKDRRDRRRSGDGHANDGRRSGDDPPNIARRSPDVLPSDGRRSGARARANPDPSRRFSLKEDSPGSVRPDVAALLARGWRTVTPKQRRILDEIADRHDLSGPAWAAERIASAPPGADPLAHVIALDREWQAERRAEIDADEQRAAEAKADEQAAAPAVLLRLRDDVDFGTAPEPAA